MKNRKILLPALLSVVFVCSLILPASVVGGAGAEPLPDEHVTASFSDIEVDDVGIKAGDWIKFEYTITGWPTGQPYPEWLKLAFLSVEGTSIDTMAMLHLSDGTEQNNTVPVDVVAGGSEAFGLSGAVIPSNLTTGDSIYMYGFGNVTIEGETTRTYAGARRTVLYSSISQSAPFQGEIQFTYHWDRLTGVMVETSATYPGLDMIVACKITETNMWEATTVGMPWWLWVIIAVAIGAVVFIVYRLKKKTPTTLTRSRRRHLT
ncbi:MAG: hypothetical protein JSW40_08500 [Candidatus Omnitrophota bacterium]|nr:MAG: hypothetical protein JSW40_08500 [Candidatus Omnitrophota bacterium]